jgi:peroxiredoxin
LPHLNKVYDENKEAGLKVFAINVGETKDKVQPFVENHKLTIPVLLDGDNKVSSLYMAESIPETVLINKDGTVRKVFVGFGEDSEQQLRQEIAEAMKAK